MDVRQGAPLSCIELKVEAITCSLIDVIRPSPFVQMWFLGEAPCNDQCVRMQVSFAICNTGYNILCCEVIKTGLSGFAIKWSEMAEGKVNKSYTGAAIATGGTGESAR